VRAIAARAADYDIFARNVAIAGGLLLLIGMGSGRFGIDNLKKAAPHPKAAANSRRH
jgi:uncharacterized membrane protein YphA (DoxX/SURF4 family)